MENPGVRALHRPRLPAVTTARAARPPSPQTTGSPVQDMQWTADGERICIAYRDGNVRPSQLRGDKGLTWANACVCARR